MSEPVIISTLGGVAVQLLYVLDGLKSPKPRRPDYNSVSYYFGILVNVALSTILGYVYFDDAEKFNKIVYFHIGASAPLILRTLASTIPEALRNKSNED